MFPPSKVAVSLHSPENLVSEHHNSVLRAADDLLSQHQVQSDLVFVGVHCLHVSHDPHPPGSLAESGTKQRSKTMSAFCTHLRAILFSILVALSPGVPFFTRKQLTCKQGGGEGLIKQCNLIVLRDDIAWVSHHVGVCGASYVEVVVKSSSLGKRYGM